MPRPSWAIWPASTDSPPNSVPAAASIPRGIISASLAASATGCRHVCRRAVWRRQSPVVRRPFPAAGGEARHSTAELDLAQQQRTLAQMDRFECNLLINGFFISTRGGSQRCTQRFGGFGKGGVAVVGWRPQPRGEKEMRIVRMLAVLWTALFMVNGCGEDSRKEAGADGESPTTDALSAELDEASDRLVRYTEQRAPCRDYTPLRQPLFGDVHVHTSFSFDAAANSIGATPADAHRFAQRRSHRLLAARPERWAGGQVRHRPAAGLPGGDGPR